LYRHQPPSLLQKISYLRLHPLQLAVDLALTSL
jgi:hypothetical protein